MSFLAEKGFFLKFSNTSNGVILVVETTDALVMAIVSIVLIVGVVILVKNWLSNTTLDDRLKIPFNDYIPEHPALDVMRNNGYDVVGGRIKIPLYFEVDQEEFFSRVFIDYVALNEEGAVYMVKIARKRLPLEWTGSSLRDHLLTLFLLYPDAAGVLYVDVYEERIRRIHFDWDEEELIGDNA
ncbi:hypothetical protein [Paenibacillus sp. CMAA1364]